MNKTSITVLIVDDCEEDREMFRRYLLDQADGAYVVLEAESGIDGWELCQSKKPDCVLMDYQLPDFDGLEFVEALNKERGLYRVPVLMLTGRGDERVAAQAISFGAQDYLVKGKVNAMELRRAIAHSMDRVKLLRKTEDQRIAIENSQKELEQFAFALHHDLQVSIRRMGILLDSLQRVVTASGSEDSQAALNQTVDILLQMRRSVQDSLEYSLLGEGQPTKEMVDLQELLKGVEVAVQGRLKKQQARLTIESLPKIYGSRTLLWQLFQNLIENALKCQGEDPVSITISGNQEGKTWHFRVQDTGVGMDLDSLESIFSDFRQLQVQEGYPGSGIALALCKKVVDKHAGRMWVESAKQRGSVFHFILPMEDGPDSCLVTETSQTDSCVMS